MLFARRQRDEIRAGRITMTVRRWSRPQARVGGRYRIDPDTVIVADAVVQVPAAELTDLHASGCGFEDLEETLRFLHAPSPDELITLVRFHTEREPDARLLRGDQPLDEATLADVRRRLARLDALRPEPWTLAVLEAIRRRPATRAAELAASFGRETLPFKVDVRKLKALGLTRSLQVGYELSPLGAAFLARV